MGPSSRRSLALRRVSRARSGSFGAGGGAPAPLRAGRVAGGERRRLTWVWVWVVAFGVRLDFLPFEEHLPSLLWVGDAGWPGWCYAWFPAGQCAGTARKGTAGPQGQISPGFPSSLQVQRGSGCPPSVSALPPLCRLWQQAPREKPAHSRSQPRSQAAAASLQSSPLAPALRSLSLRHGRAGIAKATLCFGSFASPAQPGAWLAPFCACFPPTAARNAGDAPRP